MWSARFERHGDPATVLTLAESEIPTPRSGEVRVRMLASPVNPSDLMFIRGTYGQAATLPAVPGFEGVGRVDAAGPGLLGRFMTGRRVAVLNRAGGNWAEQVVVPARQVIPLSSDLSVEEGATFFVNPATAYLLTRRVLRVPPGAWLIQSAAGSAVGRMVIRLGRHYGFRTLNVVRRAEQVDELQALGGDAVLEFGGAPDAEAELVRRVHELTGGVRYAIDPVGGAAGSAMTRCLGQAGRLVVYGSLADQPLTISPRHLMVAGACVEGFWLRPWMDRQPLPAKLWLVRQITRLIRRGVLRTQVAHTLPLTDLSAAMSLAERPGRGGKVLLNLGED